MSQITRGSDTNNQRSVMGVGVCAHFEFEGDTFVSRVATVRDGVDGLGDAVAFRVATGEGVVALDLVGVGDCSGNSWG